MSEMIEFGKYRGQPIEVLASDPKYTEWLASQPWLKDRHPTVYNVIINNFGEPEETPEHNRLQAKFMDEAFVEVVGRQLFNSIKSEVIGESRISTWDNGHGKTKSFLVDEVEYLGVQRIAFEEKGIDVTFWVKYSFSFDQEHSNWKGDITKDRHTALDSKFIGAELKPQVGDDYPAILREMTHKGCNLLIYESFQSEAINEIQLEKFFATRKIKTLPIKKLVNKKLLDEI